MNWQTFAKLRFYASVGIALVGLSAASTLLTTSSSQAQDPIKVEEHVSASKDAVKVEIAKKLAELKAEEVTLGAKMGDSHPKVVGVRAQIAALESILADKSGLAKAGVAEAKAAQEKARKAMNAAKATTSVFSTTSDDPNIITDNLVGTTSRVIVRQTADGDTVSEVQEVPPAAGYGSLLAGSPMTVRALTLGGNKESRELQKVLDQLKSKESSEDEKKAARAKAEEILSKQFDEDLTQREKQVEELEKQLSSLKEQIVKRRDAKKRLMELRMELLINESEGLGFPNAWQTSGRLGGPSGTLPPLSVPGYRYVTPAPGGVSVPGLPIPPAALPVPAAVPAAPAVASAPAVAPAPPAAPAPAVAPAAGAPAPAE